MDFLKNKWLWIILAALLIGGGLAYYFYKKSQAKKMNCNPVDKPESYTCEQLKTNFMAQKAAVDKADFASKKIEQCRLDRWKEALMAKGCTN